MSAGARAIYTSYRLLEHLRYRVREPVLPGVNRGYSGSAHTKPQREAHEHLDALPLGWWHEPSL